MVSNWYNTAKQFRSFIYSLSMRILIINGNPQRESLSNAICSTYEKAALESAHKVRSVEVRKMTFDPILHEGYHQIQALESDLLRFQQDVLWADHLVFVYPTWWGGMPAILKGLIDRSFLPGFAFQYHEKGPFWDKLLKGRSAHIITTMDAPRVWDWFFNRSAGLSMLKHPILKFCGISPIKKTVIDRVRHKSSEQIQKDLEKVKLLATNLK